MASAAASGAINRSLRPARARSSSSGRAMERLLAQEPLVTWAEQVTRSWPRSVYGPLQQPQKTRPENRSDQDAPEPGADAGHAASGRAGYGEAALNAAQGGQPVAHPAVPDEVPGGNQHESGALEGVLAPEGREVHVLADRNACLHTCDRGQEEA